MILDNGLTKEQQKQMDYVYENLMSKVKSIDIKLYTKLRKQELTEKDIYKLGNSKNDNIIINNEDQYEFFSGV